MNRQLATLFDDLVQKRFDLSSLARREGERPIKLGRSLISDIRIGEDSSEEGSKRIKTVSREHGYIVYDLIEDAYYYKDESSNGTLIRRKGNSIVLDRDSPPLRLQSGDQIYFSKIINKGYGPLLFRQCEVESQENEQTQRLE